MQENHQQAIQEPDNKIQGIQFESIALQAQRDVYQVQLQCCQDQIMILLTMNMYLVQMIQLKITSLCPLRKAPPLKKMSSMSILQYQKDTMTVDKHKKTRV